VITMLGGMSTDELSHTISQTDDHSGLGTPLLRRPWVVPLALVTVIFVGYAVPPYLTLDPALARIQPMPPHASYYPRWSPTSSRFGGASRRLPQVWPWLRGSHPAVHR
jgi:hypothetical protein